MPAPAKRPEVAWFRAFGSAPRLAILRALVGGPMSVKEVAAAVGSSQPMTTHSLNILRRVGLVKDTSDGSSRIQELVGGKVTRRGLELTHPSGAVVVVPLE